MHPCYRAKGISASPRPVSACSALARQACRGLTAAGAPGARETSASTEGVLRPATSVRARPRAPAGSVRFVAWLSAGRISELCGQGDSEALAACSGPTGGPPWRRTCRDRRKPACGLKRTRHLHREVFWCIVPSLRVSGPGRLQGVCGTARPQQRQSESVTFGRSPGETESALFLFVNRMA